MRGPGADQVAKTGGESLDLGLDPFRHVDVRPGWHVAIRPGGRLPGGRARWVPRVVLSEQRERAVRVTSGRDLRFRLRDLGERAAKMDRARATKAIGGPRDLAIERPVDLEDPGAVAEGLVAAPSPGRQPVRRDRHQGLRGRVEEYDARRRQLVQAVHALTGHDLA